MNTRFQNLLVHLEERFAKPHDDASDRRRKAMAFITISVAMIPISLWTVGPYLAGLPLTGSVFGVYLVLELLNLVVFYQTRNYRLFVTAAMAMVFVFPFAGQITLGGYVRSGTQVIWAVLSPVGALMFMKRRHSAIFWYAAFLLTITAFILLDPQIARLAPEVPDSIIAWNAFLNVAFVSAFMFGVIAYFMIRLEDERQRADNLLLNILPAPIAEKLKTEPGVIADEFNEVTVLFADIVDFTTMSAKASPVVVLTLLNDIFSEFDAIAARHGLEKIKTIGDAYMVVGGLPDPRPDHAQAIMLMAQDMLAALSGRKGLNGEAIRLRIGINSGPVVAGVIGTHKFIYDLWGDAVNTASRMESNGLANTIQVTETTYNLLKDQYSFEKRDPIFIKGKGEMVTYLLTD